jgi:septum formation protein
MKLFLASKSPRRREILSNLDIEYELIDCEIEEKINFEEEPRTVAMSISFQKCNEASKKIPDGNLIISADTIVVISNKILGKPKNNEDAFNMLSFLKGKPHQVITGYTIIESGSEKKYTGYAITDVYFKDYSDDVINWYIDTKEPLDKAGSYGIQGKGSLLVEKISGDYFNVIGFPISKIVEDLKKYFGYNPY